MNQGGDESSSAGAVVGNMLNTLWKDINDNNDASTTSSRRRTSDGGTTTINNEEYSQKVLIQYGLMFVGLVVVMKIIVSSLLTILGLMLPLLYLYMLSTCPPMESFDGKRYLKRVLRGQHLPENHPDKPKGYLEQMAAKFSASVKAEAATLPGYQQELTPFGGAFIVARMTVPSSQLELFWVGAFQDWHFLYSRELTPSKQD